MNIQRPKVKVTVSDISEMAMTIALEHHLSDWNTDLPAWEVVNEIADNPDSVVVWEPFEFWPVESLLDSIHNLYTSIMFHFNETVVPFGVQLV